MNFDKDSSEYKQGVEYFVVFLQHKFGVETPLRCPCKRCMNSYFHRLPMNYQCWIHHGETLNFVQPNPRIKKRRRLLDFIIQEEEEENVIDDELDDTSEQILGPLWRTSQNHQVVLTRSISHTTYWKI